LIFLLSNILKSFGVQIFWSWAYLKRVIHETRRVHLIWNLRPYSSPERLKPKTKHAAQMRKST
jgi:hypothetical protein